MNGQLAFVLLILFITTLFACGLAVFSWQRRHVGLWAYPFTLVALTAAWWTTFYALELFAPVLDRKILWAKIEYIAISIIPVLWFIFAMTYTGWGKRLRWQHYLVLMIIPLLTIGLVFTNENHGLIWSEISLDVSGPFPILDPSYGSWFWVHSVYSYALLLISSIALIQAAYKSPSTYRWQNIALNIGVLIPWVANVIYLLDLGILFNVDLSPVAFVASAIVIAWSIFRVRLFDVVPIARQVTVDTMQDGVIVLDIKNRVVDMNPAALAVFESNLSDVIGKTPEDLLADWPELVDSFIDVLQAETEIRLEGEGEVRYYELHISPLFNSRQKVNGRLVVFHDITSYKQTEAALAEARDQALEASQVKTELLARVSHELRTPLNVILGFSEMMQLGISGPINEKQYETLDKILESTRFLTEQVNDLLDLSSIEAGTHGLHCHPFAIHEVIDEVIEHSQKEIINKALQLEKTNAQEAIKLVYGDRDGVTQILTNLVGNAIKFSDTGTIQISAFAYDDAYWALQVIDEGPGIPEDAQDFIFEPFRQIDGSMTRIHGGTGLGLAIVKQLTELMGGKIQLSSEIGQGSTFTVLLPNETQELINDEQT